MLVRSELNEKSEQYVQRFNHWLIILKLVDRNVAHRKHKPCVVTHVHVDFGTREIDLLEGCLHLRLPLFHQCVEVGHIFRVVYCWGRPRLVQVLHCADPPWNFLWLLVRLLYRINVHRRRSDYIFTLDIFELQNGFIFVVEGRFVENCYTQVFLCSIGLWHLQKSVHLANCRNVVRYKWFDLSIKVNLLGFVPLNVFKQFFYLTAYWKISVLGWIVCSGNFFLIIIIVFIFLSAFLLLLAILSFVLGVSLLLLRSFLLTNCTNVRLMFYVHVNINLIFFFIWLNFLTVIHIDC